jgi:hypothetical protein
LPIQLKKSIQLLIIDGYQFRSNLEDYREQIFWTMLNHHGGKEFWLKLKNILDFALFVDKYKDELDWQSLHLKSIEFKMETVFLNGLYFLKKVIKTAIPTYMEEQLTNHKCLTLGQTLVFWEKSHSWTKPTPKLNYELILLKSQDSGFNRWAYFKAFYKSYTLPSLIEPKRLITFPERFHFLNFLSKVFSYIIK